MYYIYSGSVLIGDTNLYFLCLPCKFITIVIVRNPKHNMLIRRDLSFVIWSSLIYIYILLLTNAWPPYAVLQRVTS